MQRQPTLDARSFVVSVSEMLKICFANCVLALASCHILLTDFKLVDTGHNFNAFGYFEEKIPLTIEECAMNCLETDGSSFSISRRNVCRLSHIYLKEEVNNQGVYEEDEGTRIFTRVGKLFR